MSLTKEEKTALFEEWIERLGLGNWAIRANFEAVPSECKLSDVSGEAEYSTVVRSATIRIIREEALPSDVECDFEKVLVHELLHLKFSVIYPDDGSLMETVQHILIEDLACAMVDAKRHTTELRKQESKA